MKKIILSIVFAASIMTASAQSTKNLKPIANETFMTVAEKSVKVKSSNEKITAMLLHRYKEYIIRYSVNMQKKDRFGKYSEYTIFVKKDVQIELAAFLKSF